MGLVDKGDKCSVKLAVIELIHAQNDIAFVVVAPFTPFVCKLARVAVLASCGSVKFYN